MKNNILQNGNTQLLSTEKQEFDYSIKMDCDDDVIVISVRMYKFFMAHGTEGREAKELYQHLIFTSRMQYGNTNIRATANYLKNGLIWGEKKLKRAKAFLSNAGLIEYLHTKDENSGLFLSHTINVKRMWNEDSLSAWLDRKVLRSQIKEQENSTGANTAPVDNNTEPTPQGQFTTQWIDHPSGDRTQTKKDIEKETYKREKEETLHEVSFSDFPKFCKYLESQIEIDGKGLFLFPSSVKAALEGYCKTRSFNWVLDQFEKYRGKKTAAQVRRFCETDLPKFLLRAHESEPKELKKTEQEPRICPVCGSEQPVSGSINYCPRCTLPANEFKDLEKVEEHRLWYEDYHSKKKTTPHTYPAN